MNRKIILTISLLLLVGVVGFVSAQDSAQRCPEGQIWYNSQCMTTGSTESPEVIYGCEKGEKWNEAERKCVPSGDSAPTAGTCPQGCTCTANSISCTTNAGTAPTAETTESDRDITGNSAPAQPSDSAPNPTAGTCPQGCTCTENAISCTLGEESPSADTINSETGAGSGQTEKGSSIVEITRNKEQQTMSINVKETKASTTAEVIIKERKLYVKSGATEKQIKVMPNTASEIAVEKLGNLGFTIELKETGNYELKAEKQAILLFIFPITAQVSASIDAENGKINSINKPWWSFLASGI